MPTNQVKKIAEAIAHAEGFYAHNSRPARNHNPGDMTLDLVNKAIRKDGKTVKDGPYPIYENDEDGWENLYAQVEKWLDGDSHMASPESTIYQLSRFYTTTDQDAWAANVAKHLGVTIETKIKDITNEEV